MSVIKGWALIHDAHCHDCYTTTHQNAWLEELLSEPSTDDVRPLRELLALITDMNEHELGAVLFLARRLAKGRKVYGPLNPHDGRDWLQEAAEEFADLLVYAYAAKEAQHGQESSP